MAVTSGGAASRLAKVLGIRLGTVNLYAQALRDGGLLSKHGRGPAAAIMTPGDIAGWLIAMTCAETAAAASAVVRHTLATPALDPPDCGLPICRAATVREFLIEVLTGGSDHYWLSHVDFYVGGGEVEAVLRPVDPGAPYGLGPTVVLHFIRSQADPSGLRWRDTRESPLCERQTINRVTGTGLRSISELVGGDA